MAPASAIMLSLPWRRVFQTAAAGSAIRDGKKQSKLGCASLCGTGKSDLAHPVCKAKRENLRQMAFTRGKRRRGLGSPRFRQQIRPVGHPLKAEKAVVRRQRLGLT
ncbi:hypothetical protein N657DRAFT_641601 [Parathielavia appendiculata]|uniref:Uncharacterized protein n=1 Tax=Parathielavia appendiculata TaxID=2587402 RepID=A0AAN6U7B9_9PEZI|nr:hypothetical protein N657DRAFT_641601 [Parathielavia appendiculata]